MVKSAKTGKNVNLYCQMHAIMGDSSVHPKNNTLEWTLEEWTEIEIWSNLPQSGKIFLFGPFPSATKNFRKYYTHL